MFWDDDEEDKPKKLPRKGIVGMEDFRIMLFPVLNDAYCGMRRLCVKVDKVRRMRRRLAAWR